jgi:hypothetical protein
MADESRSFADDDKAQELAEGIERACLRAGAELHALRTSMSPRLKVGAAMQHAKALRHADELRAELLDYVENPEKY